ncbi:MAG: stage II sporulation protein R [Oscillospiraceae bacterium]|nr:stage II sporulation protein R [Oscillospiraceae bacterium]
MKNIRVWEIALAAGVVCAVICGAWASSAQSSLSDKLVRLHVVANSDAEHDQELKRRVRDGVLEAARPLIAEAGGADAAALALENGLPYLQRAAREEIERLGYAYPVTAELAYEDFPTREYDGFSIPAGRYRALRVTIGQGAGRNWWCVVFPPLCDAAAAPPAARARAIADAAVKAGLSDADALLIAEQDGIKLKFRCVELWQELRRLFR